MYIFSDNQEIYLTDKQLVVVDAIYDMAYPLIVKVIEDNRGVVIRYNNLEYTLDDDGNIEFNCEYLTNTLKNV